MVNKTFFKNYPECIVLSSKGFRKPCFWIHPLTGSIISYLKIATNLNIDQPVLGIQSKGFLNEQKPLDSIEEMAKYYVEIIKAYDSEGPYQLAGYSMGGLIAYEMAIQLKREGRAVQKLILLEPPFVEGQNGETPELDMFSFKNAILLSATSFLYSSLNDKSDNGNLVLEDVIPKGLDFEKMTEKDLIVTLVKWCKEKGVNQPIEIIEQKVRNMADIIGSNRKALASYGISSTNLLDDVDIHYITVSQNGEFENSTIDKLAPILALNAEVLGDHLTHTEEHYIKWNDLLPHLQAYRVDGPDHFHLLTHRAGVERIIKICRDIYKMSSGEKYSFGGVDNLQSNAQLLEAFLTGKTSKEEVHKKLKSNILIKNSIKVRDNNVLNTGEDVAIIGMSGRFPGAATVQEFWKNIEGGVDSLIKIPKDRWDIDSYFDAEQGKDGKIYSPYGGFVENIDQFDPLFFNISPGEAKRMDPQYRIFLQETWKALEDAACKPSSLSGKKVGVFFGGTIGDYAGGSPHLPSTESGRISYLFNWKGPCICFETTCSSALVALHEACLHIQTGLLEMAVVGGVGLMTTPMPYIGFSQVQALSPKGKCFTFDKGADGTIFSESVCSILLKPLSAALSNHDHVYGVIKGVGINYDGKTNGLTAPSGKAQMDLETETYKRFNINPEDITMIEAHGTGTKLGDPIEVNALIGAFNQFTEKKGYCALGSVKSNIGHTGAAAGLVGLIKVLLSIQNKKIPPTINYKECNPAIAIEDSPFYINSSLKEWTTPNNISRIGAISSFGFSGTNAHVVVEEVLVPEVVIEHTGPAIIILSAKNRERLLEYGQNLLHFAKSVIMETDEKSKQKPKYTLANIAYTLQVGREPMDERLGMLVNSVEELVEKLELFLDGKDEDGNIYSNHVKRGKEFLAFFDTDDDLQIAISSWISKKKYAKLIQLWINGAIFDWNKLYGVVKPYRISLPTYPFAKTRYWTEDSVINEVENRDNLVVKQMVNSPETVIKPLMGTITMAPVWDVFSIKHEEGFFTSADKIVIIGGTEHNRKAVKQIYPNAHLLKIDLLVDTNGFTQEFKSIGIVTHIIWLSSHNYLKENLLDIRQNKSGVQSVIQVFRIIKALLHLGYGSEKLGWTVITINAQPVGKCDSVNPNDGAIHGLVGSMAKEYPNWKVRLVDLEEDGPWPIKEIMTIPSDPRGDACAYRDRQWYRQLLIPFQSPERSSVLYREDGVYVLIGGASAVGEVWSEYMIRNWKARIVWIGRREKNQMIEEQLDKLSKIGLQPTYITADGADLGSLKQAYNKIKEQYSQIHGVIHSAVVYSGGNLETMDEVHFLETLSSKVDVSLNIFEVFKDEPLDFVLFFSSINSFLKAAGQSNYGAGCMFMDALAHKFSLQWPCVVKVLNWGYWGSIGKAADIEEFQDWMVESGIASIEPQEAMEILERLLAEPINQMALVNIIKPSGLNGMNVNPREFICFGQGQVLLNIENIQNSAILKQDLVIPRLEENTEIEIKEMDRILMQLLWGQLRTLGLFNAKTIDKTEGKTKLIELYEPWMRECLTFLKNQNYLNYEDDLFTVCDTAPVDIEKLWKEWERKKEIWLESSDLRDQVFLVEVTMRNLPDILTGRKPATDIIFPDSSTELVERIYKGNKIAKYVNEVLANTMLAYVQERVAQDSSAKIRILEIGAGTGGTSEVIFQKLRPYCQNIKEYCYTDISKAFLIHGEQSYGSENPYLTYKLFNVEKPIAEQGFKQGEYDLVIAANVLHATKNIRNTIENGKAVLKKNGLVLLNEVNGSTLLSHLTFGLLEGWWLYEDAPLRIPGSPGLSPESWKSVLENEGFSKIFFPVMEAHEFGQQIIVGESDGVIRQKWDVEQKRVLKKKSVKIPGRPSCDEVLLTNKSVNERSKVTDSMVDDYVRGVILEQLSDSLKMEVCMINNDEPFSDYGLDSILGVRLIKVINEVLGTDLETTSLFDYSSVNKLTSYILSQYKDRVSGYLEKDSTQTVGDDLEELIIDLEKIGDDRKFRTLLEPNIEKESIVPVKSNVSEGVVKPKLSMQVKQKSEVRDVLSDSIAVIGISCRYAKSESPEQLWENLANGNNLVEEITRWDMSKYYEGASGKENDFCNYGSFLDDIDKFDPLLFNISGLEATYMDPQQRFFLEESWTALEDAGYVGSRVQGSVCGVYLGCTEGDYYSLFKDQSLDNSPPAQAMWGNNSAAIPARIAYHLDLQGPAIAVNTACSSSLVAIHLACQGLRAGETELALAGGVFIQSTPGFYLSTNLSGMLSKTGRCYTFDERADGFVPGEGVGVVVLKRLKDAINDGDHIYGVIAGSGINQDGQTNGITAPSSKSQERLERFVYDSFNINPEHIQMVEAHGTGTILGDPIEFNALKRAFREYTDKKGYCAIGSIKTNIGHTTTAAGIAGIIKVLLSLKNKKIPPSLNYKEGNPNINFEESPFYVNCKLKDWDTEPNTKRCGTVSSFGLTGTNAHIVLEEAPELLLSRSVKPGYLIVLSAQTSKQRRQQVEQLVKFCETESNVNCGDVSYTLLVGRKHFSYRLAFVVENVSRLVEGLKKWLVNGDVPQLYVSEINEKNFKEQAAMKGFGNETLLKCLQTDEASLYMEYLSTIADLYTQGYRLEYEKLFPNGEYSTTSLPTYPFAKERYWVDEVSENESPVSERFVSENVNSENSKKNNGSTNGYIHPLLHKNISDFSAQRFGTRFTGSEFFLSHHIVKGNMVLPGVTYLEMARAAIEQAVPDSEASRIILKNVVWIQPFVVNGKGGDLNISLHQKNRGQIEYEIYQPPENGDKPVVYSQGIAEINPISFRGVDEKKPTLDLVKLQKQCERKGPSSAQCYEVYRMMGIEHGPGFQGMDEVYLGEGDRGEPQVLAKLFLPESISYTRDQFVLHPGLMDSALQAAMALNDSFNDKKDLPISPLKPALPFALEEIEIFGPCTTSMWALIRNSNHVDLGNNGNNNGRGNSFNVTLCDSKGQVCVSMKGFSSRVLGGEAKVSKTTMVTPVWNPVLLNKQQLPSQTTQVAIVGGYEKDFMGIQAVYPNACWVDIEKNDTIDVITKKLNFSDHLDHIVWIASVKPNKESFINESLIENQEEGVLKCFRIVKALLGLGYGAKDLELTIITTQTQKIFKGDQVNPGHASIYGFIGSLAKEYSNWKVRLLDLEDGHKLSFENIFSLPFEGSGNGWAYRGNQWYKEYLTTLHCQSSGKSVYRSGGVYVVIGGAGGIGEVWSEYMIRTWAARIVWIGRRKKDSVIDGKLSRLAKLGSAPLYIAADATNLQVMGQAYGQIKKTYSNVNGVIHSAIVLKDQGLMNMEEDSFMAVLSAKVDISVRLAQVFNQETLDFVMFFSSFQSFTKSPGQSNYAAGCTFKDAFAHQLANEWDCKVKVMNWGYWGSVGIVSSDDFREKMAEVGVDSIEPPEAMTALETLLREPIDQIGLIKTTKPLVMEELNPNEKMEIYDSNLPSINLPSHVETKTSFGTVKDKIKNVIVETLSNLLKVNSVDIDEGSWDSYGVDPVTLAEFAEKLNLLYNFELNSDLLVKYENVPELGEYLANEFGDVFKRAETDDKFQSNDFEDMEELLFKLLLGQLQSMGLYVDKSATLKELSGGIGLAGLYDPWFRESLRFLADKNYLTYNGNSSYVVQKEKINVENLWMQWEQKKKVWLADSDMAPMVNLVEVTLKALPNIISGKQLATDVMFPGLSMKLVEGLYKENKVADYFSEVLANTLVSYIEERLRLDNSLKIRILEVGAGTGGTTGVVLEKLKPYSDYIQEYCYTDLSKAFLIHGEKLYGAVNPYLTYKIFNVEEPLGKQTINQGEYDVVIGGNVLHATKNIRQTLRIVKGALKNGGLLMANEMISNSLFVHLTFGLLEGWWLYDDSALRIPGCPGLDPKSWAKVLKSEGFYSIFFPAENDEYLGQQTFVAESDGVVWSKNCVQSMEKIKKAPQKEPMVSTTPLSTKKSLHVTIQMVNEFVRTVIRESVASSLRIDECRIQDDRSFSEYGVDSIIAVQLINAIGKECDIALQTTILFDYNDVNQLSSYLIREHKDSLMSLLQEDETEVSDKETYQETKIIRTEQPIQETPKRTQLRKSNLYVDNNNDLQTTSNFQTYHKLVIEGPGVIDDLKIVKTEVKELKENEVEVAVYAFSLNFGDLLCVKGLYPNMPPYPFTPGFEVSGVVVNMGKDVKSVKIGDSVIVGTGLSLGGHASRVVCIEEQLIKKPESLTYEEACSLPAVAMTMIDAFHKAKIQRGEKILIQTATGGTGLIGVQLALHHGAIVFGTAGSQRKLDYLKKIGVSYPINYLEDDFEREIDRLTGGEGVDVVINTLSGDAIQKGLNCLAPGGRYIEIAMTALKSAKSIDISGLSDNQTLYTVDLGRLATKNSELVKGYSVEMVALVEENIIKPYIHQVFPFDQVKEAYRCMENRENIGKIIVAIPEHYRFKGGSAPVIKVHSTEKESIAIIGVSGRFAKSKTINELWDHLSNGDDLTEKVTRWNLSDYLKPSSDGKMFCEQGSFLDNIDHFDPLFFNLSKAEAVYMDPQQRLFLEECWHALEDAGYAGSEAETCLCGVYAGCGSGDYQQLITDDLPAHAFWGNTGSIVPARISYYLNLQGPAVAVDTACSSSLVAIHLACQGLWSGEMNMALAGGVFVQATPGLYVFGNTAGMLSSTGKCHTFDKDADGFVPGEGVGIVVLKRLKDAEADGDHIYGVIKGSGINQDGKTNGITAPSTTSQERLERSVYDSFNINPENITMVEAHGTGTVLGDPIECKALKMAFEKYTDKKQYCAVGSIKTNLGHGASVAGVAGLIKVLLSLKNRQIPPSINFKTINPNIEFENTPFYVNTTLKDWKCETGSKRCAVVSSFGFSGTNAHMAIEEAPQCKPRNSEKPGYLIVLSARTFEQLKRQVTQLVLYCEEEKDVNCGNMSYTLLMGRKHLNHRLACVIRNGRELVNILKKWIEKGKVAQLYISQLNDTDRREQTSLKEYGNQTIKKCGVTSEGSQYLEHLAGIAELYIQGYGLEYNRLFPKGLYSRIPLPTYPFAEESYWVKNDVLEFGRQERGKEGNHIEKPFDKPAVSVNGDMGDYVVRFFAQELDLSLEDVNLKNYIQDYGVDSIVIMKFIERVNKELHLNITSRELYQCRTIESISDCLIRKKEEFKDSGNKVSPSVEMKTVDKGEVIKEVKDDLFDKFKDGELTLEEMKSFIEQGETV